MATPIESSLAPASSRTPGGHLIRLGVLGGLLLAAFWPILLSMYGSWFDERAYMEHGILVIPAVAYMIWSKRDTLRAIPPEPSAWGVALLAWGALQALLGTATHWVWVSRTAFVVSVFGLVAITLGFRMIRELIYPLCMLFLMIAPPTFIFERATLSLQLLSSRLAETSLEALGFSVLREGNVLDMVGIQLSVEEACSGIRSLMAILFMCSLYNYFFVEVRWMRWLILLMAVPIAILGNAGRIVATGIAGQYNRALVGGIAHESFGYVSVSLAALGCIALHILMVYSQKVRRARHGQ
ncbi:MAG TPA: exosortase/archaeosortase family protein [Bryobacteraceae bacterium]|nr:exosortase/archaeosortase family protein [Bryobacteraceae bacterium]